MYDRICRVGQNHIYTVYIRIFGSEIIKYTVIYGVHTYVSGQPYVHVCHAQLLAVTVRVIWLVGFSVVVILPSLVQ